MDSTPLVPHGYTIIAPNGEPDATLGVPVLFAAECDAQALRRSLKMPEDYVVRGVRIIDAVALWDGRKVEEWRTSGDIAKACEWLAAMWKIRFEETKALTRQVLTAERGNRRLHGENVKLAQENARLRDRLAELEGVK